MINLQNTAKNVKKMENFQGEILFSEPMSKHTTFEIGGDAQAFAIPENEQSFLLLLDYVQQNKIPYFILGGGSNIVVSDLGIEGFVISTEKLSSIEIIHNTDLSITVRCGAGCTIESIIEFCIENELSGLETFAGLPGTVGGALFMNARCYDKSISDVLANATFVSSNNFLHIEQYIMNNDDWDYKLSPFQSKSPLSIILSADFKVEKGCQSSIREKCDYYTNDRKSKGHFSHPCAGSVFKNNRNFGKASGQIIDSAGLKGFSIGNAQIAPWHGNLIINLGGASADNIREIVAHVQNVVQESTGKRLECEILFVGKFV